MIARQWKLLLCFACFAWFAATAAAQQHQHAPHRDFERFRARMEDPARAAWQQPEEVVRRLGLGGGEHVADIGAGTGYFTSLLARLVGPAGRVYAVDLEAQALAHLRTRFEQLPHVEVVRGSAGDPKLPGQVDVVFICNTWHHIKRRHDYARLLRRYLRHAGRVVIVDFKPDADPSIGPPKAMRLSPDEVARELREADFAVTHEADFLPLQYMLSATLRPASPR